MPSNHLILCRPLFLLPSIFPSIRVFSNESALHIRWPKYWNFSFSISLSNEYSGLISFRMDWLDLLAVQGTLKSLYQHHSSKASIRCSAFFIVQLSHPYMTTGKTTALARRTFVGKGRSSLNGLVSCWCIFLGEIAVSFIHFAKKIFLGFYFLINFWCSFLRAGFSLAVVCGLPTVVAFLVWSTSLRACGLQQLQPVGSRAQAQ